MIFLGLGTHLFDTVPRPGDSKKKIGADTSCRFQEKRKKTHTLILKNDVTEPRLGYSNNQLYCFQIKRQFQAFENHGF